MVGVFIINKRRRARTVGHETTSQGTIQGTMRTADLTRTEVGGKTKNPAMPWTGPAGLRRQAGQSGGHCLQTSRIITPKENEGGLEVGADPRRSRHRLQVMALNCIVTVAMDTYCKS